MPVSTPINKQMTAFEWMLIACLSMIWGGAFFFAEVALQELPPFTVVFGRVGFAAFLLHALVRLTGQKMPGAGRLWAGFFVMGVLNNAIPFSLIVWSQTHLTSGVASIFNATTPFFAVVLAHFLTRDEQMSVQRVVGVVLGIFGIGVIVGATAFASMNGQFLAQLAVIGAAISYAFAGIFGRRFSGLSPLVTATGQVTASALLMAPVAFYMDRPWTALPLSAGTWGAVLGLAVVCTALAYVLYFRILKTAGATNLMIVTLLIPPSAIVLGVWFLEEVLKPREITGMLVIGVGLLVLDGRLLKRFSRFRL